MMRASALLIAVLLSPSFAQESKPPELTPEEQKLAAKAVRLNTEAEQLYRAGRAAEAVVKMRQCLEIIQQLCPVSRYPDGHPILAHGLNSMGILLQAAGLAEDGLPYCQQALAMNRKFYPASKYPDGHPRLATTLTNLGVVLQEAGLAKKAITYHEQALAMSRALYPPSKYPDGHFLLATCLNNMGRVLQATGSAEKALPIFEEALVILRQLYPASKFPDGHRELAAGFNNLADVLRAVGSHEKAITFYGQALAACRKLYPSSKYPDGHPELAITLGNMGSILNAAGFAEKAMPFYEQALAMSRTLYPLSKYPNGHPALSTSLNNMGFVLVAAGSMEEAITYYEQALAMKRKLYPVSQYPEGHPRLATSLDRMGSVLQPTASADKSLPFFEEALAMFRQLYPKSKYPSGHPDLATSLINLGTVLLELGQAKQALPLFVQGLEIRQDLLRRELAIASEETAFDKVTGRSHYRDSYLTVTRTLKTDGATSFTLVWPTRSLVTRLLEQRQANARAAGTELGDQLDRLRGLRRRTDQLLQDSEMKPEERDKLLASMADDRDKLERELMEKIPAWKRWRALDDLGPADLARALPPKAVFIDVIRYTHFEYVDKKQKRTPSYVAFVLTKQPLTPGPVAASFWVSPAKPGEESVVRVEMGPADAIDAAVAAWRAAIDTGRDVYGLAEGNLGRAKPSAGAADDLRQLVWTKLAAALPPDTTTLYLTLDGDLARLPWAALPVGDGKVLLEKYAIAQVPHGLFLLDHLKNARTFDGGSLFALGGLDYGSTKWPKLPGTLSELNAISALAPAERESRSDEAASGDDATPASIGTRLAKARYVHLATHGEFKADELSAEKKRAAAAMEARLRGDESRKVAAKNPLGYVGVVLSKGEVLSGLGIVDLPLTKTQLVTLSACETGLGELTGGEGVQGLQRAFHLAGVPNVVASLWKVNDAATAALMAKFYHELWVNKKPPIEALRTAQLTIYRHPELIPDLAGERGAPKLKEAVAVRPGEPSRVSGRIFSATKLWAAFVLSGVGR